MLRDGLKAYWKMDESSGNISDSVGGFTGVNNGSATFAASKINNGISLSGSGQFFALTDTDWDWMEWNSPFSFSGWINLDSSLTSSANIVIFGKQQTTVQYPGMMIDCYSRVGGELNLEYYNYNSNVAGKRLVCYSNDLLPLKGTWAHIVVTYDGSGSYAGVKFYYNNVLKSTTAVGGFETNTYTTANSNKAAIGSRVGDSAYNVFKGGMDEVAIWNRALNADEVSELYNAGNGYQFDGYYDLKFGEYLGAGSATTKLLMHLNGNSADSSGNNNHGTDANMTYVNGKLGQCGSFNGSNGRIQVNDSEALTLGGNFTISVWVNPTALPSSGALMSLVNKLDFGTGVNGGYDLRLYNASGTQKIGLWTKDSGGLDGGGDMTYTLPTGAWTLITGTYDGSYSNLYINGSYVTRATNGKNPGNNSKLLNIGNFGYYTPSTGELGRYFNGLMDELILESRAWSASEIKKYYTYSKGRFNL